MTDIYCPDCKEDLADGHDDNCPTLITKRVRLELVDGVEGPSVYLNEERIAGPKPWGGGKITKTYLVERKQLKEILNRG